MELLIWGAGAIGGTIGAYLIQAGHTVTFVDRDADHVAAINRAKYALEHYPEAPQLEKTLQLLVAAYEQLGMTDLATDARRVLRQTFGDAAATASLN